MYYCLEVLNDGVSMIHQDLRGAIISENYQEMMELARHLKQKYYVEQGYPVHAINIKRLDTVATI